VNVTIELDDWRLLERIVGLTSRLGCRYTALDVREHDHAYRATIDFAGPPDALRRLDAQLNRLLADDKEMSR
jgi:hypothetical protein